MLSAEWYFRMVVEIEPTEIVYLNGTTQTIYEVGRVRTEKDYRVGHPVFGEILLTLGPKKKKIVVSERYEPVLARRQLGSVTTNTLTNTTTTSGNIKRTTEKEEEIRDEGTFFKALSVMAQIGGFTYFLRMVLGFLLGVFSENLQAAELINWIKSVRSSEINPGQAFKHDGPKPKQKQEMLESQKQSERQDQANSSLKGPKAKAGEGSYSIPDKPNLMKVQNNIEESKYLRPRSRRMMVSNREFTPYTYFDVIRSSLWICRLRKNMRNGTNVHDAVVKFREDKDKLYKEVDVVNILNHIRELKLMVNSLIEASDNILKSDSSEKVQENLLQSFKSDSIINKSEKTFKKSSIKPTEDNKEESKAHLEKPNFEPSSFNSLLKEVNKPIKNMQKPPHKDEIKSISRILSRELDQMMNEASFHQQINEKVPLKESSNHS